MLIRISDIVCEPFVGNIYLKEQIWTNILKTLGNNPLKNAIHFSAFTFI